MEGAGRTARVKPATFRRPGGDRRESAQAYGNRPLMVMRGLSAGSSGAHRRRSLVREGGVEPPRPCGHWNLNPARLPIPPPAHWVCPPAPFLSARRLPTRRTLARWTGWIHIRSRRGPARASGAGGTYQPCTGPPRPPRSRTTSTAACGTLVRSRLYDPWQQAARAEFEGGPRGELSQASATSRHPHGDLEAAVGTRRHRSAGSPGGTSRSSSAWIRSVSSTK